MPEKKDITLAPEQTGYHVPLSIRQNAHAFPEVQIGNEILIPISLEAFELVRDISDSILFLKRKI